MPRAEWPSSAALAAKAYWFDGRDATDAAREVPVEMPVIEFRWQDPANPDPGFEADHAAAQTSVFKNGAYCVVSFRTDMSPEELHRQALHELQHCADAELFIAGRFSRDQVEERARNTAARLAWL